MLEMPAIKKDDFKADRTAMDLSNEVITLSETIRKLDREKRTLEWEAKRASRTIQHMRGTIDKLQKTIINQALLLDKIMPGDEEDEK